MSCKSFHLRDIIAIDDLSREEIDHILDTTVQIKEKPQPNLLNGKILGTCFFEPSTRTRLSFEAAMYRLGGQVIGFTDAQSISTKKGESLYDTMKMMEQYTDLVVIRHPLEGAARLAADAIDIPVINAGDGANQHPTQTFLDLFTIRESQGALDQLHIALAGDLKYGRTVHSLAQALSLYNPRLYLISPQSLEMPHEVCELFKQRRIKFSFHQSVEEVIPKCDILYMTRLQEERFVIKSEYQTVKQAFSLQPHHLKKAKKNLKIMHPLPRVQEISPDLDSTPYAHYFAQAQNGLFTRMALLGLVTGALK